MQIYHHHLLLPERSQRSFPTFIPDERSRRSLPPTTQYFFWEGLPILDQPYIFLFGYLSRATTYLYLGLPFFLLKNTRSIQSFVNLMQL